MDFPPPSLDQARKPGMMGMISASDFDDAASIAPPQMGMARMDELSDAPAPNPADQVSFPSIPVRPPGLSNERTAAVAPLARSSDAGSAPPPAPVSSDTVQFPAAPQRPPGLSNETYGAAMAPPPPPPSAPKPTAPKASGVIPIAPLPPTVPSGQPQPTNPQILTDEPPAPAAPPIMLNTAAARNIPTPKPSAQQPYDPNSLSQAATDLRDLLLGPAYGAPLKADSDGETLVNSLLRFSSWFSTPTGVATSLATAGLGPAAIAATARYKTALSAYPKVAQAIDTLTRTAVSGGFGAAAATQTITSLAAQPDFTLGAVQTAIGAVTGDPYAAAGGAARVGKAWANMTQPEKEQVIAGLISAGVSTAAFAHAIGGAQTVSKIYQDEPVPATVPPRQRTGATQGMMDQARPEGVEPPTAQPNAEAVRQYAEQAGQKSEALAGDYDLAAEVWLRRAEAAKDKLPTQPLNIDGRTYDVREIRSTAGGASPVGLPPDLGAKVELPAPGELPRRPVYGLYDDTGALRTAGSAGDIANWVRMSIAPRPADGAPPEDILNAGALESAIEEQAQRYQNIRTQQDHLASGQDVQMSADTMRLSTPEQRIEMLRQNIAAHQADYETGWKAIEGDIGPEAANALRAKVETAGNAAPPPEPSPDSASGAGAPPPAPPEVQGAPLAPSAALDTVPETPATLDIQVQQLQAGQRRVVMFPAGAPLVKRPKGMQSYQDEAGNTYFYNPALTTFQQIDQAVQQNRLPELLGATQGGMGAPDKSQITPPPEAVVAKDAQGDTVQATLTDQAHLGPTIAQTEKVTPPGGAVEVEPPQHEIARRMAEAAGEELTRGNSEIPVVERGEEAQDAARLQGVTRIIAGPLGRTQEMAQAISQAQEPEGAPPIPVETADFLRPWSLGGLEGKPAADTHEVIEDLVHKHQDTAPPGQGPLSSYPAESHNQLVQRFVAGMQPVMHSYLHDPSQKIVLVTHSRNLRVLQAWVAAGTRADGTLDPVALDKPVPDPGTITRLSPGVNGWELHPAGDASQPGIYIVRHAGTPWNKGEQGAATAASGSPGEPAPQGMIRADELSDAPGAPEVENALQSESQVAQQGGPGEKSPPQEQPQKPEGEQFDRIAADIARFGFASKREITEALRSRGLLDSAGRNASLLRDAIARRADVLRQAKEEQRLQRITPFIEEAKAQLGTRAEEESESDFARSVDHVATQLADEAEADAAHEEYKAATERERIQKRIAEPRDYADEVSRLIEEQTGIRSHLSGISEAHYFEVGGHKMRIAAHAARPTYERMYGAADAELMIGNDLGESTTHTLSDHASLPEVERAAAEMAGIIERWKAAESESPTQQSPAAQSLADRGGGSTSTIASSDSGVNTPSAAAAAGLTPDEIAARVRAALAASRGPAPGKGTEELPAPATVKGAPPKKPTAAQRAKTQAAFRRQFFTPGNVVTSYGGALDRVLKYEENPQGFSGGIGAWRAQVIAVDQQGNPLPNEGPRWHATEPSQKENRVVIAAGSPPLAPASIQGAPPAPDANPLRAAGQAARDRLRAKYNGSTLNSGVDPQDLIDLSTIGAEHMIDGALKFKSWVGKVMADLGELVHKIAGASDMTPDALLREVHSYAAPAAAEYGAIAEPPPPLISDEEKRITETEADNARNPAGAPDSPGLDEGVPGADGQAAGGGTTRGGKRSRGSRRRSPVPVRGQGNELEPVDGTGEPGVGDAAGSLTPKSNSVGNTAHEHDYRIPDNRIITGSPESRARANLDAIAIMKQVQGENRPATQEEKEILARYVGWGAVKPLFAGLTPEWKALQGELRQALTEQEYSDAERSVANAHYTGDWHIDAIWKALQNMGAKPGMVWLEPAVGIGTFFGRQPAELLQGARRLGIDKDSVVGQIAQLLYPDSGIDITPFEDAELPKDYFDGAVSNVPFGEFGVSDDEFRGKPYLTSPIHNYFFAKTLGLVRPGGVIAFITSRYTMDGYEAGHRNLRQWLDDQADFIGAVRMPTNAFMQNAGTHVITDIIFLRRRLPNAAAAGEDWIETKEVPLRTPDGRNYPIAINEYYQKHPENILGTQALHHGQFSDHDYKIEGKLTPEVLNDSLDRLPGNQFQEYARAGRPNTLTLGEVAVKGAKEFKLGGLFFDDNGKLFRKVSKGAAEPMEVSEPDKERIRGQLGIRDATRELLDAERTDESAAKLDLLRQKLNLLYDKYVHKHGPLTGRANINAFNTDPDAPLLLSLEREYDPHKHTTKKAPLFERRMLPGQQKASAAADPQEAMWIALNETAHLDFDRMAELTGRSPEEIQKALSDKNLVYLDPDTRVWQTADEYLSGAVRTKLKQARAVAKIEPEFRRNVEALEAAQPEDFPPSRITGRLGATWIPRETYNEFAKEIAGAEKADVQYIGSTWNVDLDSPTATKWHTGGASAHSLLTHCLNSQLIKVYGRDELNNPVIDQKETLAAQEMQKELGKYFEHWLFADVERGTEMARIYNDVQNDLRLRQFDGSHLTLPGMTRDAAVLRSGNLDPHQLAAVWRMIVQRNVLLAHAPGAGKTFAMIAAGMELQRLGLANRPMYVVPNDTLTGWEEQFRSLYPGNRILVFSEADLVKDKRRLTIAKIATGDWDAVVIPHSSFQLIRVSDKTFNEHYARLETLLERQIMDAEGAGMDARFVRRLVVAKEALLTRLKNMRNVGRQDQTVNWEELAIDQLFVDESHYYKKLGFSTRQAGVAGIDQNGNQKTFDLLMKVRHTQTHGRGVVFATGTPVTNTMGELYNIMQYLIPQELAARGMSNFDEWAAAYGITVPIFEPKPEGGGYQNKARFSEFINRNELSQFYRSFADVMTAKMLKIPRPAIAGGERRAVERGLSEEQQEFLTRLQGRAGRIRANAREALPDNMLAIFGDSTAMTLDVRIVDPSAHDDRTNRLTAAADEIWKLYQASTPVLGTQLVFSDMGVPSDGKRKKPKPTLNRQGQPRRPSPTVRTNFSVYDDLIKKLIARGIPADQIATVYQAKNKLQRRQLFERFNAGDIRVMLGSTQKMGVGVNVQKRVFAIHHLSIPDRPDQLEQREARGIRQGNLNPEVHVVYYITKGSLDELKFGTVKRKAKFNEGFQSGEGVADRGEDVGDMVLSFEAFQAASSADPRVMRKLQVDNEVDRLSSIASAWRDQQWRDRWTVQRDIPEEAREARKEIDAYQRMIATRDKTGRAWEVLSPKGKIEKWEGEGILNDVSNALHAAVIKIRETKNAGTMDIGSAYGLELASDGIWIYVGPYRDLNVYVADAEPLGFAARVNNRIRGLDAQIDEQQALIAKGEKKAKEIQAVLDSETEWPRQAEYDKLVAEQQALFKALGGDKGDASAAVADDGQVVASDAVAASEGEDDADATDEGEDLPEAPPARKDIGPIADYKPGRGTLPAPEFQGRKGWMHGAIDGEPFYTNGSMALLGEAPGAKGPDNASVANYWKESGKEQPVEPRAYSAASDDYDYEKNEGTPGMVWFSDQTAINSRFYDHVLKRYPDATFTHTPDPTGESNKPVFVKSGGKLVGLIAPMRRTAGHVFDKVKEFLGEDTGTQYIPPAVERTVHAFLDQDVLPALQGSQAAAKKIITGLVETVFPRFGVDSKTLDVVYALKGDRDKAEFTLRATVEHWRDILGPGADNNIVNQVAHGRMDLVAAGLTPLQAFQVDFMDRIKTGAAQETAELQNAADFLRQSDDVLYKAQTKYKDIQQLANHQRVMWKVIPGSQGKAKGKTGQARRPLPGTMGQFKRHVFENMSDGIKLGGVPFSYNPVDNFVRHYVDVMKFLTTQRWWAAAKKMKARIFVPFGKRAPEGFDKLDDRIAHSYLHVEEGMVDKGEWYVEHGMAKLMNAYVSRDLLRDPNTGLGQVGNVLMAIKNGYTAVELGLSGFHWVFETLETGGSSIGLGLSKILNRGAIKEGLADIGKGLAIAPAAREAWKTGDAGVKLLKNAAAYMATPEGKELLKAYPDAVQLMDDLFKGGGRVDIYNDYKQHTIQAFREAAHQGNYIGAGLRSLGAGMEALMVPLFEWYIPKIKVGVFLREYSEQLLQHSGDLAAGKTTRGELARKTWDFVEDRFGEMNFDNLFWNRTFKTAMQIVMRSVTWKFGSVRAGAYAVGGTGKELREAARDKRRPRLTPQAAWALGMAVLTAAVGALITYLFTGDRPRELKDLFFPRTDKNDPRQRVSPPTYAREYTAIAKHPLTWAAGGVSGLLSKTLEVHNNKNYYNQRIWEDDDPAAKVALKIFNHYAPWNANIGLQSFERIRQEGGGLKQALPSFLGAPKAPRYITETPAEELLSQYREEAQPQGGRSLNERNQIKNRFTSLLRAGREAEAAKVYNDGISAGTVTPDDMKHAAARAVYGPLLADFSQLFAGTESGQALDRGIRVMAAATPQEQQHLGPVLAHHLRTAFPKLPPVEQQKVLERLKLLQ